MFLLNKVTISGRVGKDAEVIEFQNGGKIAKFSVAVSDDYKKKDGEWENVTHWVNIIAKIPKVAERAEGIKKGDVIMLEGKLYESKWEDKEGGKHSRLEVEMMGFQKERVSGAKAATNVPGQPTPSDIPTTAAPDDDLPF